MPFDQVVCDARRFLATASADLLVAHISAVAELSTYALLLHEPAERLVRAIFEAGLDERANSSQWHIAGLPTAGADAIVLTRHIAPTYALYFSVSYHALQFERTFKKQLHERLAWLFTRSADVVRGASELLHEHAVAVPLSAGAALLPTFRGQAACGNASSARLLVVDSLWMRGFASHRVTRPLVTAMARTMCTTLFYGFPAGGSLAVDDDANSGFAESFGLPLLNESATGSAAWRYALAAAIERAHFDAVWFSSVGMTSVDVVLASFRLARTQALGVGHPSSTGSRHMTHFFSGAVPEVLGPLASSVLLPFGGDCRARLQELEEALAALCVDGVDGDVGSGARMPVLALCGGPASDGSVCRLCRSYSLREGVKGQNAPVEALLEGECRGVGAADAPALLRRLEDAQHRYSELLVLAPGIGMGLTSVVSLAAHPYRRNVPGSGCDAEILLAAALVVNSLADVAAQQAALAKGLDQVRPPAACGEGWWAAGSSPVRPLVVGLSWSNPKLNPRHFQRLLEAIKAAQVMFSLQWRRCVSLRASTLLPPMSFASSACGLLLDAVQSPALHVQLLLFTPMDALRAAAFEALVVGLLPPSSSRGSVVLKLVWAVQGHMGAYLDALSAADLAVDSQPFAGGNTMHDLLALSIPTVSLSHDGELDPRTTTPLRWRSALGASFLTVAGLSGLVALEEVDLRDKVARLACNPLLRAAWRLRIARLVPHEAIQAPWQAQAYASALKMLAEAR